MKGESSGACDPSGVDAMVYDELGRAARPLSVRQGPLVSLTPPAPGPTGPSSGS